MKKSLVSKASRIIVYDSTINVGNVRLLNMEILESNGISILFEWMQMMFVLSIVSVN